MEDIYVLGVDIGGSHIACQLVNLSDCSLIENTYAEVKVAENQSAGIILAAWEKALKECMGKAVLQASCLLLFYLRTMPLLSVWAPGD